MSVFQLSVTVLNFPISGNKSCDAIKITSTVLIVFFMNLRACEL